MQSMTIENLCPKHLSQLQVSLFPVPLSSAPTFKMPLLSISKVTSICGCPRGAGGIPPSSNLPSKWLSSRCFLNANGKVKHGQMHHTPYARVTTVYHISIVYLSQFGLIPIIHRPKSNSECFVVFDNGGDSPSTMA